VVSAPRNTRPPSTKTTSVQRNTAVKKSLKSQDPWFDQPYVASKTNSDSPSQTKRMLSKNRKTPVAALLGGLK
jgi:hypothetical protein